MKFINHRLCPHTHKVIHNCVWLLSTNTIYYLWWNILHISKHERRPNPTSWHTSCTAKRRWHRWHVLQPRFIGLKDGPGGLYHSAKLLGKVIAYLLPASYQFLRDGKRRVHAATSSHV